MRFLSENQIGKLYSTIKNPRMRLITDLPLTTGLYLKEILELKVSNVLFKDNMIQFKDRNIPYV